MSSLVEFGFVRVAAGCPSVRLADPAANALATIALLKRAEELGVAAVVFPECGLAGYTCGDLFHQRVLHTQCLEALHTLQLFSQDGFGGLIAVGVPLVIDDQLFNCAVLLNRGHILGIVPKTYLPTYREFYDARYFAPASTLTSRDIELFGKRIPIGTDLLFECPERELVVGVEICEDLWGPIPPSSLQAAHGANFLLNLSAGNETVGKAPYRKTLVENQSARCVAAYVYAGAGDGESSTDIVFAGPCLIAENGLLLAKSERFSANTLTVADVDLQRLRLDRLRTTTFGDAVLEPGLKRVYRRIPFEVSAYSSPGKLQRTIEAHPFVPQAAGELDERCQEIFQIQIAGLARRLQHKAISRVAIGVSGGLDSTLALLVLNKTFETLGYDKSDVRALTMPGFGTTKRTLANARQLMNDLGIGFQEIDIRSLSLAEMKALNHTPFGIPLEHLSLEQFAEKLKGLSAEKRNDVAFENVQARVRTSLLMNSGFVVGTGDLSELAVGWCTYNADHMSMYNVNVGVPKTLVKFLVQWAAQNVFAGVLRKTLLDIADTVISPELLPHSVEGQPQSTESAIGPYELVDFFLYYFLRFGFAPAKILYLATQVKFDKDYSELELKGWLQLFLKRFFDSQYKRSCIPDGPKVGSVSLSPRGDWRMPSDAVVTGWLRDLE